MELTLSLEKDFDQGKAVIRMRQTHQRVEGALCPIQDVQLWESPQKYYCQAKSEEGAQCQVEVSRRYGSHEVTRAKLGELVGGVPLRWELEEKGGYGTRAVLGYWDWDASHIVIEPLESRL